MKLILIDRSYFASCCSYVNTPSMNVSQLKVALKHDNTLASSIGEHGSAAFYAADRDGDDEFIITLLNSGQVPSEHIYEAIGRASSNGLLGVLRVFFTFGGDKFKANKISENTLTACDHGNPNGPCYRYIKYVIIIPYFISYYIFLNYFCYSNILIFFIFI